MASRSFSRILGPTEPIFQKLRLSAVFLERSYTPSPACPTVDCRCDAAQADKAMPSVKPHRSRAWSRALPAAIALVAGSVSARGASEDASAMLFYGSCMAAANIVGGTPTPSNAQAGADDLDKAPMCFGAITAITKLEPLLKSEFAMCPPRGVSFGEIVLVVTNYLRSHPDQLHENFHRLAVSALREAWPCSR